MVIHVFILEYFDVAPDEKMLAPGAVTQFIQGPPLLERIVLPEELQLSAVGERGKCSYEVHPIMHQCRALFKPKSGARETLRFRVPSLCAPQQVKDKHYHCDDQDNVNQAARDMKRKSQEPQNNQYDADKCQHK